MKETVVGDVKAFNCDQLNGAVTFAASQGQLKVMKKAADMNVSDRVSVFLELAEAHRLLDEPVGSCLCVNFR